ncbi:PREDICTED: SH3 domain-binding glutamic acid-rich-like protein 3 [Nanorana parkeri]|uniref:SH3 domain-binding glutamic acid-rich-like protein 3 n=1 Tax=Nanorana parkeri TaxID=125878 RepID=UPI000854679B|nr:PREDICTED: SH3 domain-binding glutamic acid-rich-like protein 3 [Nanorana parkeri]
MALRLFITTVTGSRETKSQQSEMTRILDSCGHPYEVVDIAVDNSFRTEMREKSGNPNALPPQLFLGDKYLGGFQELMAAVEDGDLEKFLGQN